MSSFENLRIVDNFYQTSAFFPMRLTDYFADYPKGVLTFHLESDDPFEIRKRLPNVAIMGGLSTDLMAGGTPEEVTARAKLLCDELGRDGGFILSEGKMVSYRNDARPENIMVTLLTA